MEKLPFDIQVKSFLYRIAWYAVRRCWAHNNTCVHCTRFGFCKKEKPALVRVNGTWCCGDYVWDIFKLFKKYIKGKTVVIQLTDVPGGSDPQPKEPIPEEEEE